MTVFGIIDTFTFYGADVILLAFATAILTQLLKKTVLKNAKRKLITFLPFVLGTVLYCIYATAVNFNVFYVLKNYVEVLEHGFAVGALATVSYVVYEQFVREKNGLTNVQAVITNMIEGYVTAGAETELAVRIASAIERDVTGSGIKKTEEIITENAIDNVSEKDIHILSRLIIETLARLR